MSISTNAIGKFEICDIANFAGNDLSNHDKFAFTVKPPDDTVTSSVSETANDGSPPNTYLDAFFSLPFVFADGSGSDAWTFDISRDFFAAHVGTTILYTITLTATNSSGQFDGSLVLQIDEFLHPFDPKVIKFDTFGITRTALTDAQASAEAHAIDESTTTEAAYVNGLLASVANTTIPAVAVEGSMYAAVGSSDEITKLVTQFLPAQVENAMHNGLNPQVYACEVLGLAFAAANENGGTAFATFFGPSNPSMPNTVAGDAAFASSASNTIFGSAATANTPGAIAGFVDNWKAFYTSSGIPGIAHPTADQIDLVARGAAWGDAVGVALANNLGPLPGQVINFLEDAAQQTAKYGASLASQPTPAPFEGAASAASAASQVQLTGIPEPAHHLDM